MTEKGMLKIVCVCVCGEFNDLQNHADPASMFVFPKHFLPNNVNPKQEGIEDLLKNTLVRQKVANMGQKAAIPLTAFKICIQRQDLQYIELKED